MNTLVIEKQTGGYFKFTLNGDTANAITSIQNDLLAVGTQLHFKTGNGANIIKEQFIYPADLTVISGGTFTFTTVAQVWNKLIEIGYFAWLGGGGTGGVDRFDELLDTFSYTGKAGKVVVVDNSELKLVPVTFYNKRLFTELEDTPSSLVPNKMVVVNEAGTSLILQDQPAQPEQLLNSVGYFDYNDLITHTFPLSAVANTALKLTNDTNGANTSTSENPYGVSYVWDNTSNAFNFSELSVGDTVDIRIHVQITTTTSNQRVILSAKFGIGSVVEFTNIIYENQFKSAGLHEINFVAPFYMGSTYITDNPAELYLTTDASASVIVDGWYIRILRKNINIITVDYTVPDATNLVKGIVRLGGDLAGTADSPTVPGLTTKVPTTRTIGTTSPLLGGGALSSDLTLSIQQGGSTQNGYLSSTDWLRFDEAHNDRIVSAGVTGTTTKTLTLNQHDGGTVTASWTDNNTDAVTSVFGRTGAVVSATGDYTTTQVTEGTNLYYTNTRVSANTDVAANTAARHSAVTIGTANGLSLASQTLSLALASTSTTGALSSANWNTFNGKQNALSGTGIVKSTAGVISYLTDNTANWDSAYNDKVTSATVTGTTTKTLTLTQQDGGTLTTSWTDNNTDAVTSVFGRTGAVIAVSGDYTTSLVTEDTNLYYTEGRVSANTDVAANTAARHSAVTLGTSTNGLSLAGQELTLSAAGVSSTGSLSSVDWNTFNNKQNALTNPVTGIGTTNYIPKFTGASAIGNSLIYDDGTNVGIGTTSPGQKLDVNGNANITGYALIGGSAYLASGNSLYFDSGVTNDYGIRKTGSSLILTTGGNFSMLGGNVGIGTSSPGGKLHVVGEGIFDDGTNGRLTFANASSQNDIYSTTTSFGGWKNLRLSSNELILSSGGTTERMRITSGGNVGIGQSSPFNKLTIEYPSAVVGNSSADGVAFQTSNTGDYIQFLTNLGNYSSIQAGIRGSITGRNLLLNPSGGNVGIGTTSPTAKLTISGTGTGAAIDWNNTTATTGRNFRWVSINSGGFAVEDITASAERMRITSGGLVGIGTTAPSRTLDVNGSLGVRSGVNDATVNGHILLVPEDGLNKIFSRKVNGANSDLSFNIGSTEQMRISSGGNVGIGTTSPAQKLSIVGSTDYQTIFLERNLTANTAQRTGIVSKTYSGANNFGLIGGADISGTSADVTIGYTGSVGANQIILYTAPTYNGGQAERMRITSAGNVGIGTNAPTEKLEVTGTVKVSGSVQVGDNATAASATNVGAIRYRSDANNSYMDMVMQTGASTYAWVNVVQNNW